MERVLLQKRCPSAGPFQPSNEVKLKASLVKVYFEIT